MRGCHKQADQRGVLWLRVSLLFEILLVVPYSISSHSPPFRWFRDDPNLYDEPWFREEEFADNQYDQSWYNDHDVEWEPQAWHGGGGN